MFGAFKIHAVGLALIALTLIAFTLAPLSAKESYSITLPLKKATCEAEIGLCVNDPYALPTPPKAANGAVFMQLVSQSDEVITILGASSSASEAVELHTTEQENGVMKMLQLPSLSIVPKQSELLKPKAKHFMLIGLKSPLKAGESLTLTLRIQAKTPSKNKAQDKNKEQSLTLTIPVREASDCLNAALESTSNAPDSEPHAHHH